MNHNGKAMSHRPGFTLIELLLVIVIIGVLAAIAIPKFSTVRERALFKAMMADLRNLQSQQELYYSQIQNNYNYASTLADLADFNVSAGVTVALSGGGSTGWGATASHQGLIPTQICAVYAGAAASVAPAVTPGVVACTGD